MTVFLLLWTLFRAASNMIGARWTTIKLPGMTTNRFHRESRVRRFQEYALSGHGVEPGDLAGGHVRAAAWRQDHRERQRLVRMVGRFRWASCRAIRKAAALFA